ncbi:MAG: response regulator [Anaerolineae bacterium]|nr:response regulator [Anaerolineae bacterium]
MDKLLAMVVEDDPDLCTIFSQALKSAGFEVEVIVAGDVAMKRLAEVVPGVVVLDLHLPNVSGRDILHYIRSDERLEGTKVLIATADASMAETLEDEADLVLLKPISFVQLRAMASRLGSSIK